ncbi:MAG: hypothetical protein QOJ19_39 [Acidimicrobiia bacterium]|nr:hypothetical protein [Acidimicrobiia bacterium]
MLHDKTGDLSTPQRGPDVIEVFEGVDLAHHEFERILRQVGPNQWNLPTACTKWSVYQVANHVVAAGMMFTACLQGCSKDVAVELVEAVDVLQPDPVTAFTDQVRALRKEFESSGALDRICHHAVADMKGIHLLRARVFDVTLHAWDIAHAISADEQLDLRLTALALKLYEPFAAPLVASGHAAPSIEISPGAPVQARLIALSGRRP